MTTVAEAPGAATHEAAPAAVLHVTQGSYTGMTGTKLENDTSGVRTVDVYDLPALDLSSVRGLVINGNTDQVFLARHAGLLTDLVARGGRVAVMGHPVTDFLPGLGRWHRLDYTGPDDLEITPGDPHPVWEGVDGADVSQRRGVTGFYARGYSDRLPEAASVIARIGPHRLPVDYAYPLGAGQVLVHGGLDFPAFRHDGDTGARLFPQLLAWLAEGADGAARATVSDADVAAARALASAAAKAERRDPAGRTTTAARGRRPALVHGGSHFHLATLRDRTLAVHGVQPYHLLDLQPGDLDQHDVVIVADRLHAELLRSHAAELLAVAERGGTLVVLGESGAHTWIPGVEWEFRPTNFWWWREAEDPGIRTRSEEHEVWEYLSTKSVVWHFHGMLRTAHEVTPLVVAEEPGPDGFPHDAGMMLYEDRTSTPGRIIASTMDPTYHHGNNFMPGSTLLLYSLLRWLDR
ncbi:hypothetical protein [Xylanimonas ulmi]|uniref:Uncharacterized protein n=1 Tax=Xylanimonas ulmi TaxID=228973 RepID=A0A4Q7M688_9MICO|nr:hypothetical protein [Xylanibacterium ulmi]RZS62583.1 hypothetical protein EV386_2923 [Xylanibacterium ulmi]